MTTNNYYPVKQSIIKYGELQLCYKLLKHTEFDNISFSIYASVENICDSYYAEKTVSDITSSEDKALYIFSIICKGAVTPLTVADVIEDLLADF